MGIMFKPVDTVSTKMLPSRQVGPDNFDIEYAQSANPRGYAELADLNPANAKNAILDLSKSSGREIYIEPISGWTLYDPKEKFITLACHFPSATNIFWIVNSQSVQGKWKLTLNREIQNHFSNAGAVIQPLDHSKITYVSKSAGATQDGSWVYPYASLKVGVASSKDFVVIKDSAQYDLRNGIDGQGKEIFALPGQNPKLNYIESSEPDFVTEGIFVNACHVIESVYYNGKYYGIQRYKSADYGGNLLKSSDGIFWEIAISGRFKNIILSEGKMYCIQWTRYFWGGPHTGNVVTLLRVNLDGSVTAEQIPYQSPSYSTTAMLYSLRDGILLVWSSQIDGRVFLSGQFIYDGSATPYDTSDTGLHFHFQSDAYVSVGVLDYDWSDGLPFEIINIQGTDCIISTINKQGTKDGIPVSECVVVIFGIDYEKHKVFIKKAIRTKRLSSTEMHGKRKYLFYQNSCAVTSEYFQYAVAERSLDEDRNSYLVLQRVPLTSFSNPNLIAASATALNLVEFDCGSVTVDISGNNWSEGCEAINLSIQKDGYTYIATPSHISSITGSTEGGILRWYNNETLAGGFEDGRVNTVSKVINTSYGDIITLAQDTNQSYKNVAVWSKVIVHNHKQINGITLQGRGRASVGALPQYYGNGTLIYLGADYCKIKDCGVGITFPSMIDSFRQLRSWGNIIDNCGTGISFTSKNPERIRPYVQSTQITNCRIGIYLAPYTTRLTYSIWSSTIYGCSEFGVYAIIPEGGQAAGDNSTLQGTIITNCTQNLYSEGVEWIVNNAWIANLVSNLDTITQGFGLRTQNPLLVKVGDYLMPQNKDAGYALSSGCSAGALYWQKDYKTNDWVDKKDALILQVRPTTIQPAITALNYRSSMALNGDFIDQGHGLVESEIWTWDDSTILNDGEHEVMLKLLGDFNQIYWIGETSPPKGVRFTASSITEEADEGPITFYDNDEHCNLKEGDLDGCLIYFKPPAHQAHYEDRYPFFFRIAGTRNRNNPGELILSLDDLELDISPLTDKYEYYFIVEGSTPILYGKGGLYKIDRSNQLQLSKYGYAPTPLTGYSLNLREVKPKW